MIMAALQLSNPYFALVSQGHVYLECKEMRWIICFCNYLYLNGKLYLTKATTDTGSTERGVSKSGWEVV